MLILFVIALMAAAGVVTWFGRSSVTLDNAARLLAEDLRTVQNRAAFRGAPFEVHFRPDGYQVRDSEGQPAKAPIGKGAYVRTYSENAIFRGVVVERSEFPNSTLVYDHRGFAHGGTIVLGFEGESVTLRIEDQTGRIAVEGLAEEWED